MKKRIGMTYKQVEGSIDQKHQKLMKTPPTYGVNGKIGFVFFRFTEIILETIRLTVN